MVRPYGISCLHILARTDAISVRAKQSSRVVNSRAIQFIVDSTCGGKPTSSENAKTRKQRQAFELSDYPLFGVMCWGNFLSVSIFFSELFYFDSHRLRFRHADGCVFFCNFYICRMFLCNTLILARPRIWDFQIIATTSEKCGCARKLSTAVGK